ncbi:dTDP-glucose 4,6-dehydratase [Sporobacter termitidis DSM 10068]|uniref:dTDP-glucose 4,6-dehydratase n=1 Tax=Sporobacter termitidis DSM 10068 TaxID=1123282 RepID=A0A1M5U961_9FIRM|nr:dTDP-glucose 4,6-dehydratase [Sporobacter termitidis]SHH59460.1 dTDP-glucose 4,6-dehydratase [Sporobacter termitidis DSM 10068]
MKLLITGGAGFIGSNFIFYMQQVHPDYELVCIDALTYAGNPETLERAQGQLRFFKMDISDKDAISSLFEEERFDAVVNFAAESHVDRSIEHPEVFLTTNILGTQALMEACRRFGVGRFHQISTDEVYGDLPLDRPDLSFDEDSPIHTSSPYSASKAAADLLALAYYRTYGLPVTISRCSNNYGPFQFPEKLIPLTIINALRGKSIPVYGNGLNRRDWIYVEDHCAAVDLILHKGKIGEVYNIGSSSEQSNLDVVRSILSELGKSEALISFVTDRPGHDLRYAINARKIQTALGWKPKTEFDNGLRKTVDWYLKNQSWWENILNGTYRNPARLLSGVGAQLTLF